VQTWLERNLGMGYIASPWLRFRLRDTGLRQHWCQPDGLLLDPWTGQLTIVEIKYQHCADAWFQMNRLYAPVLRMIFPERDWRFATCEIVKWFDCAIQVPEPPKLRDSPLRVKPGEFAVFICKEQLRDDPS